MRPTLEPAATTHTYAKTLELPGLGAHEFVTDTHIRAGRAKKNAADAITDVTRLAFASTTPDWLRHRVLSILSGVGHPMASAILTVWNPQKNTVLDFRAVEALQRLSRLGVLGSAAPQGGKGNLPGYWQYLEFYGPVAKHLRVSYRDLDRALWKWNKEGMPTS